jgi:hypothetical protein
MINFWMAAKFAAAIRGLFILQQPLHMGNLYSTHEVRHVK